MDLFTIPEEEKVCKQTVEAGISHPDQFLCRARARKIADFVINDKGEFDLQRAKKICNEGVFHEESYMQSEFTRLVYKTLTALSEKRMAQLRFRQLSFPLANPYVERLLCFEVGKKIMEKRDLSVGLLSATLTPLRQTVGSCFATAPLMLVQQRAPLDLFEELYNLITKGFFRRVIDGQDVRIPMSIKTGPGHLFHPMGLASHLDPSLQEALQLKKFLPAAKGDTVLSYIGRYAEEAKEAEEVFKAKTQSPLLKTLEFTIASLSDWKTEFSKWNFFHSLGLDHKQKGGIGEMIYAYLETELGQTNEEIEKLAKEAKQSEEQIRLFHSLLNNATDPTRIKRFLGEIEARSYHMNISEELQHEQIERAKRLAHFYQFLIDQFMRLFPEYFQEVYDPEMVSQEGDLLEDRPAGFCLLYKHGRADPSAWTVIHSAQEYIDALADFFRSVEPLLFLATEWEEGKDLIEEMITQLITKVGEKAFIQGALARTCNDGKKTPWAYESGGSVDYLVSCYFSLTNQPQKVEFTPETPEELLQELIEWIKDRPFKETQKFDQDPTAAIIMTSPTHAFLFKPGLAAFKQAWMSNQNTYTYVRDELKEKVLFHYRQTTLSFDELAAIQSILAPFGMPYVASLEEVLTWGKRQSGMASFLLAEILVNLFAKKSLTVALPFGDTNWEGDLFVFVMNPLSEIFEVWRQGSDAYRALPTWREQFQKKSWTLWVSL